MNRKLVEISKFLSFVLRHKPEAIGIVLDSEGWVSIDELLAAAGKATHFICREQSLAYRGGALHVSSISCW